MNRIEFVLVLLFTFFVIVVWVTSDIILVKPNTPDDPKIQTMIEPLNPAFDQEAMQLINNRTLSTPIRPTPRPTTTTATPALLLPTPSTSPQPSIQSVEANTEIIDTNTQPEASPTPLAIVEPIP
jgi:hypothetical protein